MAQYVSFCDIMWPCVALYGVVWRYVAIMLTHHLLCGALQCYVMLCGVVWCCMWHYVALCDVMWRFVVL